MKLDLRKGAQRLKRLMISAVMATVVCGLAGCGERNLGQTNGVDVTRADERLKVVTTLFPYYDFVRQIAGDNVELTMIVPAGMDSHSFEPTPADMRTMQAADLMICNGGAMETWVENVLEAIDTSEMTVVTLMDYVDTYEEEIVEGMEDGGHTHSHGDAHAHDSDNGDVPTHDHSAHDDRDHAHDADECNDPIHDHGVHDAHAHDDEDCDDPTHDHDGHEMEIEYDEHIWTSPVNAMICVEKIRDILCELDPVHTADYEKRAADYLAVLKDIDAGFREVSDNRVRNMIVIGDKFPFRYLAEEYNLSYRAAFSGCSSDTEPSAQTIAYLIDKIRDDRIPVIYYLELSSHRVSDIIGEETGAAPLLLHSCHNVTRAEFERGITYAELMYQNIENLRRGIDE